MGHCLNILSPLLKATGIPTCCYDAIDSMEFNGDLRHQGSTRCRGFMAQTQNKALRMIAIDKCGMWAPPPVSNQGNLRARSILTSSESRS